MMRDSMMKVNGEIVRGQSWQVVRDDMIMDAIMQQAAMRRLATPC
jgi:hypothetical protein